MRMYNPRYDLAVRAVLCGTSTGKPLTVSTVRRLIGDDDLAGFMAYVSQSPVGKYFKILTDGKYVMLGVSSRSLLAGDSPLSNQALAVFLYILKRYQDTSMPVPQMLIIEHFVSAERSAARSVVRAIDDLKRVSWIDESTVGGTAGQKQGYAYTPTAAGVRSLGSKFLGRVVSESQGRDFKPRDVSAFFQTSLSVSKPEQEQLTLFDASTAEPKYERVIRKIITKTASGRPMTVKALLRDVGEESLEGLKRHWISAGLDGYLRLAVYNDRVMVVVDAERVYRAGSAPLTAAAVAVAAYAWRLEKQGSRWVSRAQLLPLFARRAKEPGKSLARTLTVLLRKGWMERRPGRDAYRITAVGKACVGLALDLKLDDNVLSMLEELAATWFEPALSATGDTAFEELDEDTGDETDDPS
ncbi:MAG: hypothetical protein GX863_03960 [Firmicutes bacterium]|jgi:hypothetical protein|nr:hypothetical protein [Candidatus Fermentithermobacillaceae bacterium]